MAQFILKRVAQNILSLTALVVLFAVVAGTPLVGGLWLYAMTVIVYQVISLLLIVPKHPAYMELAVRRQLKRENAKAWDKVLVWLLSICSLLMYIVAALDLGRLQWGLLTWQFALLGITLYALGSGFNQWAMLHNPNFERLVRIQGESEHHVAATGPYQYLRHPGYLGSVLFYVGFPLIVGSGLSFLPSIVCIGTLMVRTYLEDRTLIEELDGYRDYTENVRYRLLPHLW